MKNLPQLQKLAFSGDSTVHGTIGTKFQALISYLGRKRKRTSGNANRVLSGLM